METFSREPDPFASPEVPIDEILPKKENKEEHTFSMLAAYAEGFARRNAQMDISIEEIESNIIAYFDKEVVPSINISQDEHNWYLMMFMTFVDDELASLFQAAA